MYRPHIIVAMACFLPIAFPAFAAEEWRDEDGKSVFNIVVENDKFAGTDRDYTNGIRLSYISPEEQTPDWARSIARALPLANDGKKRVGIAVGQSMFTPSDIRLRNPAPGERPYAGWLYGSIGMVSDTDKTLDNVMLTLGVVGPLSFAEQTQISVHRVINSPHPEGWRDQLHNEPGIVLTYERKWRGMYESTPFGVGMDITPHVGVNLGNVSTDAALGATFRLGHDLSADYGPPRIRPSLPGSDFFIPTQKLGGYLFTTIGGRVVGRDIFLDGNTFGNSPHVDKEILVGSLQVGATLTYRDMRLSYTQVFMTREYETQGTPAAFGAITLSMRF